MKRIVLALGITALLVPVMGAFEPAEARVRWTAGADFSVGGIFFSLGYSDIDAYGYGPRYFYRTSHAFGYRGYECGSACYIRDGYRYHHRDCPALGYHFHRHGYDPVLVWNNVGYGAYGYGTYRYGPLRHGYRYDPRYGVRYDRRHDRRHDRRDHRYDRRDDRRERYDSNRRSDHRDRRYDRRDDRRDDRRGRGRADRTRSKKRDN